MSKTATEDSVLDKEIFNILIEGSTQKSSSVDCMMLLPSSLEGVTHKTSPPFDDAKDTDLNKILYHRSILTRTVPRIVVQCKTN